MHRKLLTDSRFSFAKSSLNAQRSAFNLSKGRHASMNAGLLYPMYITEILPGDTFDFNASFVNRMSTPLAPIMDTAFLDQWYFYVPQRLVWDHTKEFYGENRESAWTPTIDYEIPQFSSGSTGFKADGVADNFGIPTLAPEMAVNALPFRAYRLIWNEWFRDQNTQDPQFINFGDVETDTTLDDLLPVNKRKDYFTTCLPEPQKGPDVLLPLAGYAPVLAVNDRRVEWDDHTDAMRLVNVNEVQLGLDSWSYLKYFQETDSTGDGGVVCVDPNGTSEPGVSDSDFQVAPQNLFVNLGMGELGATINQLRQAFAVQSLFELDARGSRYREFIKVHFATNVPDLTVSVPEYLGGSSDPIVVNQVVQTSATTSSSPQGGVAGVSKTVGRRRASFTKSFSEPGYVIGVCAIRTLQSYQDGLHRMWSRRSRLDFYHPVLAHIGETPVYNKELYVYDPDTRDQVFGYQEAFAEYRYAQSDVSGAFRSNYPSGSLDHWTYTNDFDSLPILSDEFIRETSSNVARTLATTDLEGAPQFFTDWWFDITAYRVMPVYGTPAMLGGRQ